MLSIYCDTQPNVVVVVVVVVNFLSLFIQIHILYSKELKRSRSHHKIGEINGENLEKLEKLCLSSSFCGIRNLWLAKKESNLIKMMFARFYLDLFGSTDNGQFTHWSEQMCHILFNVVWFVYGQAKYSIGFINTHRISFSSVNCCLLLWKLFALFLFDLWQQSKHRA